MIKHDLLKVKKTQLADCIDRIMQYLYQREIIETKMEKHIIGNNNEYRDKRDWIDGKLLEFGINLDLY